MNPQTQIMELVASELGIGTAAAIAIVVVLSIWSLIWKGFALWKSAGLRQKYWFIAILLVNSLGILEIIYLFFVARKYKIEVVERSE